MYPVNWCLTCVVFCARPFVFLMFWPHVGRRNMYRKNYPFENKNPINTNPQSHAGMAIELEETAVLRKCAYSNLPHLPRMQGPNPKTSRLYRRATQSAYHFPSFAPWFEAPSLPDKASPGTRNHQDPDRGAVSICTRNSLSGLVKRRECQQEPQNSF